MSRWHRSHVDLVTDAKLGEAATCRRYERVSTE